MAKRRYIYPLTLLLATILGCGSPSSTPAAFTPRQAANNTVHASILVGPDDVAYIKREGWAEYQSIGFGTLIYATDLIKTKGKITLLCADLQTVMQFSDSGRNPCPLPAGESFLSYDQMHFSSASRGAPQPDTPYVVYPRNTTILESRPIFQWHYTGAASYAAELWEGAAMIWNQDNIVGTTSEYPVDAPRLETGRDYLLIITDNDTSKASTSDPNKGLGFQLAGEIQRSDIEKETQSILNLPDLDPLAQKLVLAMYYDQLNINGRGLWGEANRLFAEVTATQVNAPAVHLRSGNVLTKMKLWTEALKEYETALNEAQKINDVESEADANAGLWHITGDQAQFDQAILLYETIGAQDKVDAMNNEKP